MQAALLASVMAVQLFVSPTGSDVTGNGSAASPWGTVDYARTMVRARGYNSKSQSANVNVNIAPGTYRVTSPIRFTTADSGANGFQVFYRTYGGVYATAKIWGSAKLNTGSCASYSGSIYQCPVGPTPFYTMYEGGVRGQVARTPDAIPNASYPASHGPFINFTGVNASKTLFQYNPADFNPAAFLGIGQVSYNGFSGPGWNWFVEVLPLTNLVIGSHQYTAANQVRYDFGEGGIQNKYWIQGDLSMLTQAGEFIDDTFGGFLYYWPRGSIGSADIEIPAVQDIFQFAGDSPSAPVHDITLQGLDIENTDFAPWYRYGFLPGENPNQGHKYQNYDDQFTGPVGRHGNVYMTNTTNITLDKVVINNAGMNGVYSEGLAHSNVIEYSLIEHTGVDGIHVDGNYPGEGNVADSNMWFYGGKIHDTGEMAGYGSGIVMAQSGFNYVGHSEIYNTARWCVGIVSELGAPNSAIYSHDNQVNYVNCHHCGNNTGDMGCFYLYETNNQTNYFWRDIVNLASTEYNTDIAPYCVMTDNGASSNSFIDINATNCDQTGLRCNNGCTDTQTNVSWIGGFDPSQMDTANIGAPPGYPY